MVEKNSALWSASFAESERRGYTAPANKRVLDVVRRIEAGELKPDTANMRWAVRTS